MVDIPTEEQITRFWVQHGLHHNEPDGGFFWDTGYNLVFDMHKGETGMNLDILFRYAVTKYQKAHGDECTEHLLKIWAHRLATKPNCRDELNCMDYPALALYLILQEAQGES